MRRSPGTVSLMRSSPPVTPASAMKLPISMWSGATLCSQPCRRSAPLTVIRFEPMPWMSAPIFTSMRARSCTCGSQAALPITVVPGVSAAAISAFSVAITDGSSMNTSVGRRPRGALSTISRPQSAIRAHRAERVEVRVKAPAADHVAARRRHHGAAKAREQRARRAGTKRGSARRARGSISTSCTSAAHRATSLGPRQSTSTPIAPRISSIASTSRMRGTLRTITSSSVRSAGGEDRQRAVLVPGRGHRAGKRDAAFDDELLHELVCAGRGPARGRVGLALGKRNSHLSSTSSRSLRPLPLPELRAAACARRRSAGARCKLPLHQLCAANRLSQSHTRRLQRRCVHMFVASPSDGSPSLRTHVPPIAQIQACAARARCAPPHPLVPAARGRLRRRLGGRPGRALQRPSIRTERRCAERSRRPRPPGPARAVPVAPVPVRQRRRQAGRSVARRLRTHGAARRGSRTRARRRRAARGRPVAC